YSTLSAAKRPLPSALTAVRRAKVRSAGDAESVAAAVRYGPATACPMPVREWRSAFFGMVRRYAWNAHSGNSEVPSTAACGVCYRPSAAGSSVQEIEALFRFLSHAFFRTVGPLPSRNRKSFLRRARSSRRASMTDDLHRDPGYLGQHSGTLSEPPSLRRSSARHPSALCLAPDHRRFLHRAQLSTHSPLSIPPHTSVIHTFHIFARAPCAQAGRR